MCLFDLAGVGSALRYRAFVSWSSPRSGCLSRAAVPCQSRRACPSAGCTTNSLSEHRDEGTGTAKRPESLFAVWAVPEHSSLWRQHLQNVVVFLECAAVRAAFVVGISPAFVVIKMLRR